MVFRASKSSSLSSFRMTARGCCGVAISACLLLSLSSSSNLPSSLFVAAAAVDAGVGVTANAASSTSSVITIDNVNSHSIHGKDTFEIEEYEHEYAFDLVDGEERYQRRQTWDVFTFLMMGKSLSIALVFGTYCYCYWFCYCCYCCCCFLRRLNYVFSLSVNSFCCFIRHTILLYYQPLLPLALGGPLGFPCGPHENITLHDQWGHKHCKNCHADNSTSCCTLCERGYDNGHNNFCVGCPSYTGTTSSASSANAGEYIPDDWNTGGARSSQGFDYWMAGVAASVGLAFFAIILGQRKERANHLDDTTLLDDEASLGGSIRRRMTKVSSALGVTMGLGRGTSSLANDYAVHGPGDAMPSEGSPDSTHNTSNGYVATTEMASSSPPASPSPPAFPQTELV